MRGVSPRKQKGKDHAFNSTPGSSHRGGRTSVAGEPLYPNAVIDQIDPERRRGDCRGSVAAERIWTVPFP